MSFFLMQRGRRRRIPTPSDIKMASNGYKRVYKPTTVKRHKWLIGGVGGAVIICLIIIIIVICSKSDEITDQKILIPANPTEPLPPSASVLRQFKRAAVCADGAACAEIGRDILKQNGSAVDAAIGTMFCNGLVTMQSMGLGGGFFMTIYIRNETKSYTLNAREKAPENVSNNYYKNDPKTSQNGPLSIAVPGELRGYWTAHQRFGRLSWSKIIEPSIQLCKKGFKMSKHQYDSLSMVNLHPDPNLDEWFRDVNGKFRKPGSIIKPSRLCDTLEIIANEGGDSLYNGSLSKLFLNDIKNIGGLINLNDMVNYQAEWLEPIDIEFMNGKHLYSIRPPGSGLLLGFIMNIIDGYGFNRQNIDGMDNTVETYHKIVEAFKYAYAKRTELGDTDFVDIKELINDLTSKKYADKIREKIQNNQTSQNPSDYGAVYLNKDDHGTAHISVLAENGDAVSVTSSINIYYGAGMTSHRTGIIYNSVMDDFSFPFFKNFFNLPGSPNNQLEPGKRPLSSMTPTILVDANGDVELVIGASGGTKITTAVALIIIRTLMFGDNIKEAIDAPRIHHQLFPMEVEYEYGNLQQFVDGLNVLGHKMKRYKSAGSIICALYNHSGVIYANADFRKGGDVFGID